MTGPRRAAVSTQTTTESIALDMNTGKLYIIARKFSGQSDGHLMGRRNFLT